MKIYCIYVATHYAEEEMIHAVTTEAEAVRVVASYLILNKDWIKDGRAFYTYKEMTVYDRINTNVGTEGAFGLPEFLPFEVKEAAVGDY